jgi:hypothetical protein
MEMKEDIESRCELRYQVKYAVPYEVGWKRRKRKEKADPLLFNGDKDRNRGARN